MLAYFVAFWPLFQSNDEENFCSKHFRYIYLYFKLAFYIRIDGIEEKTSRNGQNTNRYEGKTQASHVHSIDNFVMRIIVTTCSRVRNQLTVLTGQNNESGIDEMGTRNGTGVYRSMRTLRRDSPFGPMIAVASDI